MKFQLINQDGDIVLINMRALIDEKIQAIRLRKSGLSYQEILKIVPVSKSTLSVWLANTPLTDREKSVLKHRLDGNISLGRIRAAASLRTLRISRDEKIREEAGAEFLSYKSDPFFYIGICLYWAEGAKRSDSFAFTNSDPEMTLLMLLWIERFFKLARKEIQARLYIHKPYAHERCELFWSNSTHIPIANFRRTIYKPTSLLIKKRPNYMGCLRIEIGPVSYFRKYLFWHKLMLEEYRKQGYV